MIREGPRGSIWFPSPWESREYSGKGKHSLQIHVALGFNNWCNVSIFGIATSAQANRQGFGGSFQALKAGQHAFHILHQLLQAYFHLGEPKLPKNRFWGVHVVSFQVYPFSR